LVAAVVVAAGAGILAGVVPTGLVLDLVSLWPGLLPAALTGLVVVIFRRRSGRLLALLPLLVFSWLLLSSAAHLSGWGALPSSSVELAGPSRFDVSRAAMSLEIEGRVQVDGREQAALYEIDWIRRGGEVGPPIATERVQSELLAVMVQDRGSSLWFAYAGWSLHLARGPAWDLALRGDIEAELDSLLVAALVLDGTGRARLGVTNQEVAVTVSGDFEIVVPPGTPARVVGAAEVPPDWSEVPGGRSSPTEGPGYVFSPAPNASLRISYP
jgi:hypothetical protein